VRRDLFPSEGGVDAWPGDGVEGVTDVQGHHHAEIAVLGRAGGGGDHPFDGAFGESPVVETELIVKPLASRVQDLHI